MKISVLNIYGVDYKEWVELEQDLLEILKTKYNFFLNEDDCGHRLNEVLTDDDLEAITAILFEKNHGALLNEVAVQEIGYASPYHASILLGEFMLVGDGLCPFCGSNDVRDVPQEGIMEYDTGEPRLKYTYLTKLCNQCQNEWSTEE